MSVVFEKTKLLTDKQFHYCPGCNHGIIHRLVAEVIDEMNLDGKVIGVAPVGCSVFAYDYFNCDMYEAAHGRAPAVATGAKRVVGKCDAKRNRDRKRDCRRSKPCEKRLCFMHIHSPLRKRMGT